MPSVLGGGKTAWAVEYLGHPVTTQKAGPWHSIVPWGIHRWPFVQMSGKQKGMWLPTSRWGPETGSPLPTGARPVCSGPTLGAARLFLALQRETENDVGIMAESNEKYLRPCVFERDEGGIPLVNTNPTFNPSHRSLHFLYV